MNQLPIPDDIVILTVTEKMAARSYYVGAIFMLEGYGCLAVFKDTKTNVCFAQGVTP
jgi:hypothetical protein